MLLMLAGLFNVANAQQKTAAAFIDSIHAAATAYAPQVRAAIVKWGKTEGASLTPSSREWLLDSVKLVPVVKLSLEPGKAGKYIPQFSTDSLFEICAVVYPSRRVYMYTPRDGKLGLKGVAGASMSALADKSMAVTAKPLFIYLFSIERYHADILGWMDATASLQFLVNGSDRVYNSEALLVKKYGAASTYFEYRKRERIKQQVKEEALETFSYDSIRYSWQFHMQYFQQDTAASITLLLNEIRAVTHAPENKIERIRQLVMAGLINPPPPNVVISDSLYTYFKYFGQNPLIPFKSIDLTPILTQVLTRQQFERFKWKTEVTAYQKRNMEEGLWQQFKGDKKAVDAAVRSLLLKE
jgi:hypothetical protein